MACSKEFKLGLLLGFLLWISSGLDIEAQDLFGGDPKCFSCGLRGGGKKIELLSLPSALDREHRVLERAIGGIAGSSFQTEEATPEQTERQAALKAPREPVFVAPSASQLELSENRLFAEPSIESFSILKSFEISEFGFLSTTYVVGHRKVPFPFPTSTLITFSSKLATARSRFWSLLKSPDIKDVGPLPAANAIWF